MSGEKKTRIVVALGGNALEDKSLPPTAESQEQVVEKTVEHLADLSCAGYEMAIVHGNGPQVGRLLLASESAADVTPPLPFDVCDAMSQGYIGYHIQQKLQAALKKRGKDTPVVSLVTQITVDPEDPAFRSPSKPIGPFYSEAEAEKLKKEKDYTLKEDAGRGYRRVVPSPKPQKIVEIGTMKTLWDSTISIACGGGGVPVVEEADGSLNGVPAVIDKDAAAQLLARDMDADILMILTEVDAVCVNFNQPTQRKLKTVTADELEDYAAHGQFAPGSMLPKVEAAMEFVRQRPGKKAIITSLDRGLDALNGHCGTVVVS